MAEAEVVAPAVNSIEIPFDGSRLLQDWRGAPPFAAPALKRRLEAILGASRGGDLHAARALRADAPEAPAAMALEAIALHARGDTVAAAALIAEARAAAAASPSPEPFIVTDGVAPVDGRTAHWSPELALLQVVVAVRRPPSVAAGPMIVGDPQDPFVALMTQLRRRGAAGLAGDIYDNRDRGHSAFDVGPYPQLGVARYGPEARATRLDYGLNDWLLFTAPTFGNSSTALTARETWRSLPRLAMTTPAITRIAAQYRANHLYVYPAHRDVAEAGGDLYAAYTPYMLVSQGSSRSDQRLVAAVATVYAALPEETKRRAVAAGLLAPTAVALIRRSLVKDDAAYMSGAAHGVAIDPARINLAAIAQAAFAVKPDALPQLATIAVEAEPPPLVGTDPIGAGLSERLFDTPYAVARLARGYARTREYRLRADPAPGADPAMRLTWRVLRGGAGQTRLRLLDRSGRRLALQVDWPASGSGADGRVDVAVFAEGGGLVSPPAVFSLAFPPAQTRDYDAEGRLRSIDHRGGYADPLVFPRRDWRDEHRYDAGGALLGWTRIRETGRSDFTRHGARVIAVDELGRPTQAAEVTYPVEQARSGGLMAVERDIGRIFIYTYASPDDAVGFLDAVRPPPKTP